MSYFTEFKDEILVHNIFSKIKQITTQKWIIMEICGGQTHAILRYGLDQLLPENIELIHGPGCPVCVTPINIIDKALGIASQPEVIFTSYGDMLRVPGSNKDLFSVRAEGGDVRVVYSPLDAVSLAQKYPDKEVVFFAIGFETTAPANAMSVLRAEQLGLNNFSVLVSHVRVPPALRAILQSPYSRVKGILAAGHVCAIMGYWEYIPISNRYHVPIVITGFEPLDLANGIFMVVQQLELGNALVENAYPRVVVQEGNQMAQDVINKVFTDCDRDWRGIGPIPASGWQLHEKYSHFDASVKFPNIITNSIENSICLSGAILQGIKKPFECPAFGTVCTPEQPLGATMVSSEGTCSAYYQYGRVNSKINISEFPN
jgi:hydrogenase expression/formation protein HypD